MSPRRSKPADFNKLMAKVRGTCTEKIASEISADEARVTAHFVMPCGEYRRFLDLMNAMARNYVAAKPTRKK